MLFLVVRDACEIAVEVEGLDPRHHIGVVEICSVAECIDVECQLGVTFLEGHCLDFRDIAESLFADQGH